MSRISSRVRVAPQVVAQRRVPLADLRIWVVSMQSWPCWTAMQYSMHAHSRTPMHGQAAQHARTPMQHSSTHLPVTACAAQLMRRCTVQLDIRML
jgi:hypothetical protein